MTKVTAMGISSPKKKKLLVRTFYGPPNGGLVAIVVRIDQVAGPVRILSVVLMITYRHTGIH